ncbi:ABC transporter ATP-binding protein [Spirochaetia bacterium]|nr:ABC transporter ATP-binding protein [Spirochaetia bacterium]
MAAVQNISARFEPGTISAIIGPSGCGKTSLIHTAAGLRRPSSGEIRIEGKTVTGVRKKTAVIFQDYGLLPWKTVFANAELPLKLAGVSKHERRERVAALFGEFGLSPFAKLYPRRLSGGMKQRLAITRALAAEPDLLLMDEPFSSLDALTREDAQDFLLSVKRATSPHASRTQAGLGKDSRDSNRVTQEKNPLTIIIVTHSIEEAVYLADQVWVMTGKNPGRISGNFAVPPGLKRGDGQFLELCNMLREELKKPGSSNASIDSDVVNNTTTTGEHGGT